MSLFMTSVVLGFICTFGAGIAIDGCRIRLHRALVGIGVGVGLGMVLTESNHASYSQTVLGIATGLIAIGLGIWYNSKHTN